MVKRNYRKYSLVLGTFYLIFFVSFGTFIAKPRWFYWRAWEYFKEVAYWVPHKEKWRGYELGDQERTLGANAVSMHYQWKTSASCDKGGYRSIPYRSDQYPIVMGGDSQTWGSGLSDHQTIPWRVAKKLALPVCNLAKDPFTVEKYLGHSHLVNAKMIIETPVRGHLYSYHFAASPILEKGDFRLPIVEVGEDKVKTLSIELQKEKSILNYCDIHPRRYFLPAKLFRMVKLDRIGSLLRFIPFNRNNNVAPLPGYLTEEGIQDIAKGILSRAQAFEKMGYQYIFGIIPDKGVIDVEELNGSITELDELLKHLLLDAGVHYVDIPSAFRNHPLRRALFLSTDSHINESGAELVASEIVNYLESHCEDDLLKLKNEYSGVVKK